MFGKKGIFGKKGAPDGPAPAPERQGSFPTVPRDSDGKRRVIVPADAIWDDFFDAPGVDLGEREQPAAQARETF